MIPDYQYKSLVSDDVIKKKYPENPSEGVQIFGLRAFLIRFRTNYSKKSILACPQNLQETSHFWTLAAHYTTNAVI